MTVALADVLEKEWTSQVVQLARTLGFRRYHTWSSKHSASGFPDEVLLRERIVFLELKRERTKLSEPQRDWLRALLDAGAEAYVARPSDLDALALILACRGAPWKTARGATWEAAFRLGDATRKECT